MLAARKASSMLLPFDGVLPLVCMKKTIPYLGLVWTDLHREKLLEYLEMALFKEYLDPESDLYKPALVEAFEGDGAAAPSGVGGPETASKRRRTTQNESAAKRRRQACKSAATRKRGAAGAIAAAIAAADEAGGSGVGDGEGGLAESEEEPEDSGEEADEDQNQN